MPENPFDFDADTARRVSRSLLDALTAMHHGILIAEGARATYVNDAFCRIGGKL